MKKLLLLIMAVALVGCASPDEKPAVPRSDIVETLLPKPTPPKPVTPRPTVSKNYNGSRADLIKLFHEADPKAAWVLGERAPSKIENYKWWVLANLISVAKKQGAYRTQEAARLKATITSPTDRQNFANWQRNVDSTIRSFRSDFERGIIVYWLGEVGRRKLLPR